MSPRNRVSEEKGPHQHQHGTSPEHQARHDQMAGVIDDCETLLCGGMGMGAYNALTGRGIKTLLTDIDSIDEALRTYLAGKLVDRAAELLH
ncbi:MAG: NifB/NifX family molybdenum-iron cluster-binding protein [Chloroflexi bacterium]|nr:NifB/NifX family molybdenum-iron cluster-binding protein [Chloroflexota bacterium]